ncbi:MAG: PEP-CTERM sorting domain-containing protein [Akkermansiaceae bacterium]|nr:PEP-CTERM sorting domain-containing protein [Akkermansiaceae bacterium]
MKPKTNRIKQAFLGLTTMTALAGMAGAQTYQPYANGSAADNALSFNNGADATVEAPLSPLGLVLTYNNTPAIGSGGGWDLSAQGSTNLGVGVLVTLPLASTRAKTATGVGDLTFGTASTGLLSDLAGLALPMAWEASLTVPDSETWTAGVADTMTYNFDVQFSNGLLGLGAGVFPDLTLEISDGSGVLYASSDVGALLGITNLVNSSYSGSADFNYNPANGPLEIKWSASQTVSAGLLGNGDDVFRISNTDFTVTPVPEPSSAVLLGVGVVTLLGRRRRK